MVGTFITYCNALVDLEQKVKRNSKRNSKAQLR